MVQYLRYISNALKGDLGESYRYRGRDVVELLAPRLKVSLELNVVSYFVTLIIGLPLGFWAAMRQGTWKDPTMTTFMLLVYAVAGVLHGAVPDSGVRVVAGLDSGFRLVWIFSTQAILPAVTLGVPGAFVFMRYMRASTLRCLGAGVCSDCPWQGDGAHDGQPEAYRSKCSDPDHDDIRFFACRDVWWVANHRAHLRNTGSSQAVVGGGIPARLSVADGVDYLGHDDASVGESFH